MENSEAQNEELLALQSIYEEKYFIVDGMNPPSGRYVANVQLPRPFFVTCKVDDSLNGNKSSDFSIRSLSEEVFQVDYLPPINLFFEFPNSYPSQTCPAFFLSCTWLTVEQLSKLCKRLEFIWAEGNREVVLFRWIQFLQEETLESLCITQYLDITDLSKYKINSLPEILLDKASPCKDDVAAYVVEDNEQNKEINSNCDYKQDQYSKCKELKVMPIIKPSVSGGFCKQRDCRAFVDLRDGKILKVLLKDYDDFKKLEVFQDTWHSCNICFADKKGIDFITFKICNHSFCKDCLKSYFELQITEGNVHSLNCPEEKCPSQADGSVVKQIVDINLFEKYDTLLLSRTLESMADIAYCPRKACQCPLVVDTSGRMGTCPACSFVFCPYCKMGYHGVAPCNFKSEEKKKICEAYLTGDSTKREELEKRHGKRVIRSLVENSLSESWKQSYSKCCPHCLACIEKTEGCNKMTCFRCGTYFCWQCMKQLQASNPYAHFHDRNSTCYNQLFPDEFLDDAFEIEPGEFLDFI